MFNNCNAISALQKHTNIKHHTHTHTHNPIEWSLIFKISVMQALVTQVGGRLFQCHYGME